MWGRTWGGRTSPAQSATRISREQKTWGVTRGRLTLVLVLCRASLTMDWGRLVKESWTIGLIVSGPWQKLSSIISVKVESLMPRFSKSSRLWTVNFTIPQLDLLLRRHQPSLVRRHQTNLAPREQPSKASHQIPLAAHQISLAAHQISLARQKLSLAPQKCSLVPQKLSQSHHGILQAASPSVRPLAPPPPSSKFLDKNQTVCKSSTWTRVRMWSNYPLIRATSWFQSSLRRLLVMRQGRNELPLKTGCVSPVERPSGTITIWMNTLRGRMVRGPNLSCATGFFARQPSPASLRRRSTWKTASGSALRMTVPALVWNGSRRFTHISSLMSVGMQNLRALPGTSLIDLTSLSAACLKSAFEIA